MRAARACLLNTSNMASRNTGSLQVAISQNELAEVAKVMGFRYSQEYDELYAALRASCQHSVALQGCCPQHRGQRSGHGGHQLRL